jgi:hypothetical protein
LTALSSQTAKKNVMADRPPSFQEYLKSIGARWFTVMSGPLSVPLAIAGFYVESPVAKILFFSAAIVGVVFSSFWVWKTERERLLLAQSESLKLNAEIERLKSVTPKLSAMIDGIIFGGHDSRMPEIAPLILVVAIQNTGSMQSIASEFQVTLTRDGLSKPASMMAIKGPVTLGFPITGQPDKQNFMRYPESEALYRKASIPIQVGAKISGILIAAIGAADEHWLSPGTEISMVFRDILGHQYETKRSMTGDLSGMQDFAGLEGSIANN